ncbi:polyribonucleotide nucleotidyltransferase [Trichlorobacter lovleyi]|uniref:Polyribonucleotide nucleotidyltransferase n=1 Tax=Trichlorobacter lovleyi (strain ATCC BAA-1151 / DSM 17278 / SZ) TaxID=398767 RepID=PNP_TRIL1|nr:polyribonucleotide nucleotidyltransferase [Trichlorobacter lovleyi]B3EAF2.1 RecName: Full=Polyribonucleotide nucleotidyltransferase; AltName: Full=Polynucleotide phosphorylase; Short=PNPase [Trichlorobacter lovleyi SZ]ACD95390.1 Polyribonucleotide nucleotidyltransferase [Trichlorobacter lovleyi SZ]
MTFNEKCVEAQVGNMNVKISTGKMAKQASGAVVISSGDTMVLVTVVGTKEAKPGQDFFPLTVNYTEKTYAGGKIPGSFFKREGRPSEDETLICRLIDRPIRPLFPESYLCDTQVMATVISAEEDHDPAILSMIGASAALMISDIPFEGPIAGVKVGRVDGKLIANPSAEQLKLSDLEIVVAAGKDAIFMVEGEADFVSEEDLLEAVFFAKDAVQGILAAQEELARQVGVAKREVAPLVVDEALKAKVKALAFDRIAQAFKIKAKQERYAAVAQIKEEVVAALAEEFEGRDKEIKGFIGDIEYDRMRHDVLETGIRIDGRDTKTVRPIAIEAGLLPRAHGSTLFTRGETQVLAAATLGTSQDEQRMDSLYGEYRKKFMLHYNFPPFSVGETSFRLAPGRREIGHGMLAERAISAILPNHDDFPYTIRIVAETLESNGSSSMATVCGGCLSLMDAGVPVKAPVAGIAMGLIKEGEKVAILTDILGDEDHLGDMDFKVAGSADGVTALQMDIKIGGVSKEIMQQALKQAKEGRLHILGKMAQCLAAPREEMSAFAPRITTIWIKPDRIRDVIGTGGKTIRSITEATGVMIDIDSDNSGKINIASSDKAACDAAIQMIRGLTDEVEEGKLYMGTVKKIMEFGAFVEVLPGTDGLVHISELDETRVKNVTDILNEGDKVLVKCIGVDKQGKIKLSRKAALGQSLEEKD